MSCSSTSSQPSPQKSAQASAKESAQTDSPVAQNTQTAWGDDMTRGRLVGDNADRQMVMSIVDPTLNANQKAYPRYKVGNLAFVEVITMPDPRIRDVDATRQNVAIILGENPHLVALPDKALFAHFAKNIRPNPDMLEVGDRIRTALLLATDSDSCEDEPTPTWTDAEGTLTIHYHRKVSSSRIGRAYPILQACTLTVDANQDFTLECTNRGRGDM